MRLVRLTAVVCLPTVFMAARAAAQHETIDKGTLLVGGTAGISGFHSDGDSASRFSVTLAPVFGGFLWRGLAVWGGVTFGYSSLSPVSTTTWGVGPGITYYVPGVFGHVYPYIGVETSFVRGTQHYGPPVPGGGVAERTVDAIQMRPSLGLLFMLVSHVGVRGELYLSRLWTTTEAAFTSVPAQRTEQNTTSYGFSAGVTAFVF